MYLNKDESTVTGVTVNRLTLTWDVFKFYYSLFNHIYMFRLTLTWDVFK